MRDSISVSLGVLLAGILLAGAPASAQDEDKGPARGLYLQGGFSMQALGVVTSFAGQEARLGFQNGAKGPFAKEVYGGSLAGGAFVTPWLALQGRIQILDSGSTDASLDCTTVAPPNLPPLCAALGLERKVYDGRIDSTTFIYGAQAKVYPLNLLTGGNGGLLQPYAFGGIGGYSISLSPTLEGQKTSARGADWLTLEIGAGLDLMVSRHVGVFGEINWQYVNVSSNGLPVNSPNNLGLNLGVTYRF
ncbi:MAG: outer membrane beta-barrel protein [Myxococcota bacterium]|nr:outer membrane beta-barrel protein [Myxococcota bacterium]